MHPAAPLAPSPITLAIRALFDRVFRRKPARFPALHEQTTWVGVRNTFTVPPDCDELAPLPVLNYISAVALFFAAGDGLRRPTCTLAHVVATVRLVDHQAVLTALAGEEAAARLVQPLLDALGAGASEEVAAIVPGTHSLVATLVEEVDAASRQRVLTYFQSIA